MIERTLIIIKPRAIREGKMGKILAMIENEGFKMLAGKFLHLSQKQAEEFYYVHKGKDFYEGLVKFMITGPIFVTVWEGDEIIHRMRKLMGKTDPKVAEEGTIRHLYAHNIRENCIHGSDSTKSAEYEMGFFFSKNEILENQK